MPGVKNIYRKVLVLAAAAISSLLPTMAHAGLIDELQDVHPQAIALLVIAAVVLGVSFFTVSRVSKNNRNRVIAEYEAELNAFRKSIRGGIRR